jgi:hypothetical protein
MSRQRRRDIFFTKELIKKSVVKFKVLMVMAARPVISDFAVHPVYRRVEKRQTGRTVQCSPGNGRQDCPRGYTFPARLRVACYGGRRKVGCEGRVLWPRRCRAIRAREEGDWR